MDNYFGPNNALGTGSDSCFYPTNVLGTNVTSDCCPTNVLGSNVVNPCGNQTHNHEFHGSTMVAREGRCCHNHRFAGVTSQAIPAAAGHRHIVYVNTDFYQDHYHVVAVVSGPPICVGNGKHVHFFEGNTSLDDGHYHCFQFATLIENPLLCSGNKQ